MARRSPHLDDAEMIRMVFQRACLNRGTVHLQHGEFKGDFPVLMEEPGRLVLGLPDAVRGQWGLKPGAHLTLRITDRGLSYEAVVDFQGHGRVQGEEASHVNQPRTLRALDAHRVADFVPDRPLPCLYTTLDQNVRDAQALALGEEGLELAPLKAEQGLGLRIGTTSTLELKFDAEGMVLPCNVAYFGEGCAGFTFKDGPDPSVIRRYREWLMEQRRAQMARDRERFDPQGAEAPKARAAEEGPRPGSVARIHVDRDPLVLVVAEGEAVPRRMAEALGRKFGIASFDHVQGPLKPRLEALGPLETADTWGRVKLILVHQRLRVASGLELIKQLTHAEACPLPLLLVGSEEDEEVKRNRAIAAGAVDFLPVEPFNVIKVMRKIDETLKLFA